MFMSKLTVPVMLITKHIKQCYTVRSVHIMGEHYSGHGMTHLPFTWIVVTTGEKKKRGREKIGDYQFIS